MCIEKNSCQVYTLRNPLDYRYINIYISRFTDTVESKTFASQVAFQVLVNPDSYSVEKETIGAGDTEIDPNFSNQEIEWVVEEHGAILLYGLLVKLT